jgi:predicted transcriptional regulator
MRLLAVDVVACFSLIARMESETDWQSVFARARSTRTGTDGHVTMSSDGPIFLGELESAVIDYLWSVGPADVKQVHDAIGKRRGIASNTVQTTLKRLYEKGLLNREKVSHAFIYAPALSRDEYRRRTLDQTIGLLMRGEREAMVSAFVDLAERAGEGQLEELERKVAERLAGREKDSR